MLEPRIRPFLPALLLSEKIIKMKKKITDRLRKLKPAHYLLIFVGIVIYIGIIIGVVNYRDNKVVNPPKLEIVTPVSGDTYSSESVLIQGQTEPRAVVKVTDKEVRADKDGKYSVTLPLAMGSNSFKLSVTKRKLTTEKVVTVSRVAPEPVAETRPQVRQGNLNNSGPETFWLLETSLLAASGAAYQVSKKRLKESKFV